MKVRTEMSILSNFLLGFLTILQLKIKDSPQHIPVPFQASDWDKASHFRLHHIGFRSSFPLFSTAAK